MNSHVSHALNHFKQVTYLITRRTEAEYIRKKLNQDIIDLEKEADLEVRIVCKTVFQGHHQNFEEGTTNQNRTQLSRKSVCEPQVFPGTKTETLREELPIDLPKTRVPSH
jgi:hypothetical protein